MTMLARCRAVAVLVATGLAGSVGAAAQTSAPWSSAGGDIGNTHAYLSPPANVGSPTQINPRTVSSLALKWSSATAGDISATPTVEPGGLYVPDWAGMLTKLDPATGAKIWSRKVCDYTATCYTAGASISRSSPAIGARALVIGDAIAHPTLPSPGAVVIGVDKTTGAKLWTTVVNSTSRWASVLGSPVIYNNVAFVGTASWEEGIANDDATYKPVFRGNISALDVDTGRILWSFFTIPPIAGYSGGAVPGSHMAVWPKQNALLISTGNNYSVPSAVASCVAAAKQDKTAQIACLDPTDYVDSLLSIDLTSGLPKWGRRMAGADAWTLACTTGRPNCPRPSGADADFAQGPMLTWLPNFTGVPDDLHGSSQSYMLAAGEKNSVFYAVNPLNGGLFWSTWIGTGGMEWGSTVNLADRDTFYVALHNPDRVAQTIIGQGGTKPQTWNGGAWGALDLRTGRKKWMVPTPGRDLANPALAPEAPGCMTFANRVVFAGASSGAMAAVDAGSGLLRWSFASGGTVVSCPAIFDETVYWGTGYARDGVGKHMIYAFAIPKP